nr:MAG TPA: hypothetical protein [Caudoviricetes sp.]
MPATNRTKNFQLPIYQASDHFSVLGDMNSAMNMIDEKLGEATVQATAAARDATSALAAANDASDNTHVAKESAQSALSVSANAKGDAQRAQTMAEEAKTKSDKAVEMATAASTNATEANRTAATATATANAASQTANAAAASASSAAQSANGLAAGIADAKTAGDKAAVMRTRYQKIQSGQNDRILRSANDSENTTVVSGTVELNADDVVTAIAQAHHSTQGSNAIHWYLFMERPSGATSWFACSGSQGPFDGSYVHSQVAGMFKADEGAGRYTFSLRFNGPTNKDTKVFMRNTHIVVH